MSQETKSKRQERVDAQEATNDVIAVMDTAAGRRYIWRLLEKARIFSSPYMGSTNDTMVKLGEHNFGLFIMTAVIDANAELYLLMQKEHYIPEVPDKPAKDDSNE